MAIGLMTAMAPIESAFADTKIQSNVPTVNSDGSVTLKGGTTGDPKQAVNKFMGGSILGWCSRNTRRSQYCWIWNLVF